MLPQWLFFIFCFVVSSTAFAKAETPPVKPSVPLPIEHFSNLPDVSQLTLSPGGKKISAIIRIDAEETQGVAIQVTDLKSGKKKMVLFTDNTQYFIGNTWWKDDTTLLVRTWYPSDRDTWTGFRTARYDTREIRLMIINTDTGEVINPFKRTLLKKYTILPTHLGNVIDDLPDDPDHILISIPGLNRGYPWWPVVYKLNIHNQRARVIQDPEENVVGWVTDTQHNLRASYRLDEGRVFNRVKDPKTDEWRELWPYDIFSEDEVNILGFDADPNIVYISAYKNDYKAVFKVNLRDKALQRELVYADPNYDVNGQLIYSNKDNRILGIGSGGEEGTIFTDPLFASLQEEVNKALPNTRNFIYGITDDETQFVVYSTGPKESGTYYLGSMNPTQLKAVAYRYSKLPPDVLGDVQKIHYEARDGVEIEAYLTLPKGVPPKKLPTVMFPHGGPIARDSIAFDFWAHFMANRGYAVLQMNFRGSGGQGLSFRNAGLKNWGKEMQDDIEDGALALIKRGITDPDKICIVGASYGGYASLMGVVKTPNRYQCAISVNGVSNVFDLVKDNRAFWRGYNVIDEQIGNDNKTLREISPVNFANKIKAPVLLIHGELDRQVEIKHSYQMRDALSNAKKDVTFVELDGEDHYLSNEAMRRKAFGAIAAFLAEHLPVEEAKL